MLKADLHLHAGEDIHHKLGYTSKQLINHLANKGFEVAALTFHEHVFFPKEIQDYAKKKGILLISGAELLIEGNDVLVYNLTENDAKKIKTFKDLIVLKRKKNILVIAPHPYFPTRECLKDKFEENINLFDAVEYSHFYLPYINFNDKALQKAKKYHKGVVATSDAHSFDWIGKNYTFINSKKNIKSVFNAIKKGKTKIKTEPIPISYCINKTAKMIFRME